MTYLEEFKAFVAAKPADEEYNHYDKYCALGQWASAKWPERAETICPGYFTVADSADFNFHIAVAEGLEQPERLMAAIRSSETFGELSRRLETV